MTMHTKNNFTLSIPLPSRQTLVRLLRWIIPNGGTLLLLGAFFFAQSVGAISLPARDAASDWSAAPTINYQGRLADHAGTPVNDTVAMTFSLYDAQTGGARVWGPESHSTVPVSDGLFSVGLGSQTSGGIPTGVWNGDRYLEITVGGETLEPRELIRSVPIAGMALTVPDGAITSRHILDDKNVYVTQQAEFSISGDGEWNDLEGMNVSITPDVDSYAYVYANAYAQNGIESLFTLRAVLDDDLDVSTIGVGGMSRRHSSETNLYYGGATVVARFELDADVPHIIKLQGRVSHGSSARVRHRSMSVIVVKR
jgi:hypothetical protein